MIDNLSIGEILVDRNHGWRVVIEDIFLSLDDGKPFMVLAQIEHRPGISYTIDWADLTETPENAAANGR